jgi:DNA polymerase-3 subunit gamma/tau
MTFYLTYRPQTIGDLNLPEVREFLAKIISTGNIPHAFLFSGPKGTGKTSAARIIAKVVNCEHPKENGEPCNKCEQCLSITHGNNIDVVEMDAASHRGIDDIRLIKEAVNLAPARANKKVYIIDEAHMLTTEASNALLKTLEEPPEHCIFILATTNPEKLIGTIKSRTVNIMFRKATEKEMTESLKRIVKAEKIKISDEDLLLLAKSAAGSFRDGAKLLEQFAVEGKLTGQNTEFNLDEFVDLLISKNTKSCLEKIDKYITDGGQASDLIADLLNKLRLELLAKVGIGEEVLDIKKEFLINLIDLITKAGSETKNAVIEQLPLELAVIEWCGNQETTLESPPKVDPPTTKKTLMSEDTWREIIAKIKPINSSIEALLRAARPLSLNDNVLELGVYYKFHKERLEDGKIRKVFEDVVEMVVGAPTKVICTLTNPPERVMPKVVLTDNASQDIIKAAEDIFSN